MPLTTEKEETKLTEELVSENGDNINWNYISHIVDINEIWEEFDRKIKLIIKKFLKLCNSLNKESH